jgi:hypothetical protein
MSACLRRNDAGVAPSRADDKRVRENHPKNGSRLEQEITERTEKIEGEAFNAIEQSKTGSPGG